MESMWLLECLASDEARLRSIAARDLTAAVPSCPGWSVEDLVRHVAEVYLHKTECMRLGAFPKPWPPDTSTEEPLALLDRSYAALVAEFAARSPDAPTATWYKPDQTVGFWIRRMAQETVVHRIDAELALGEPVSPVPADLALDGVDEVLERFLSYATEEWPDDFGDHLDGCDGRAVLVSAGERSWLVRLDPGVVRVGPGSEADAAAKVAGDPHAALLWLWRRAANDAVTVEGDPTLVAKLRELLGIVTV
jgi:uncharacterized protein (TIGR03083 family)